MDSVLIFEPENFSENVLKILQKKGFSVELNAGGYSIQFALENYNIIYLRLSVNITKSIIDSCKIVKCNCLVIPATGIDHIDENACADAGIRILSFKTKKHLLRDIRATAELTLGLTIALLRRLPSAVKSVTQGVWERDRFRGYDIFNKKVGLIGYGRLGTIVSTYFKALGAQVGVYEINPEIEVPKDINRFISMEEVFIDSDIISIHVDYHAGNHNLINNRMLSLCRRKPFFINTSRGQIVNESDLLQALYCGLLSGAALDVVKDELEYGESSPLCQYIKKHDNLIITPHIGGCTLDSTHQTEFIITQELLKEYSK